MHLNIINLKSIIQKKLCIRLTLPAQEAVPGQIISVALGQHGVKTNDFIKEFNNTSARFFKGLPISSEIDVYSDGSFFIRIKGICIPSLLNNLLSLEESDYNGLSIKYKDLVLIAFILKNDRKALSKTSLLSIIRSLKGSLLCRNVKIVF
jgi:ribosomal protein L11